MTWIALKTPRSDLQQRHTTASNKSAHLHTQYASRSYTRLLRQTYLTPQQGHKLRKKDQNAPPDLQSFLLRANSLSSKNQKRAKSTQNAKFSTDDDFTIFPPNIQTSKNFLPPPEMTFLSTTGNRGESGRGRRTFPANSRLPKHGQVRERARSQQLSPFSPFCFGDVAVFKVFRKFSGSFVASDDGVTSARFWRLAGLSLCQGPGFCNPLESPS